MASELRRPPTRTGSGSRPPTSRFQEGSMNDRTSAAPPAHFLGPDELSDYESQFFAEPPMMPEARRRRPLSASGKLQATTIYRHVTAQDPRQEQTVRYKKSSGFFGRVRDALFNKGSGGRQQAPKDDGRRKHSSLQEPVQEPSRYPPPRPEYIHPNRAQSEINIAQMFSSTGGGADRPSREEVMASYNQLMASGFFQSHAIQSTRHAPPGSMARERRPPPLSMDNLATGRSLGALSVAQASIRSGSGSVSPLPAPRASPNLQSRDSREFTPMPMGPPVAPRSSFSSLFSNPLPDLKKKDSRPLLRGRKRTRGDETPVLSLEAHSPTMAGPTSYFAQPLKRVAKKLREMPSSTFQLRDDSRSRSNNASKRHSYHEYLTHHQTAPDVLMRPPSPIIYSDSMYSESMYTVEPPLRERSPSPMVLDTRGRPGHMEPETGRPVYEKATTGAAARRPRRTFSYTLTQSVRSRSRAIEREREREREREAKLQQAREEQRQQARESSRTRRDHSAHSSHYSNSGSRPPRIGGRGRQTTSHSPLGIWQRVSLEDTMIHRDSCDSTRSSYRSWRAEERMVVDSYSHSHSPNGRSSRRATPSPSPLRSMPGANRGGSNTSVPHAVKAAESWHWSGKAYHLKDRGSRPELGVRRSEDSGTAFDNYGSYGKENDNWRAVDADGDIDVFWHQSRGSRHSQEEYYRQQQQQQRIGNAL